ncbi:type II secretion system protein GspJ [Planctomycetota bacterium]
MNKLRRQSAGFTLIELLVSIVLIVTVVSAVCGSYLVTSRAAHLCAGRMGADQAAGRTLQQLTSLIRCGVIPNRISSTSEPKETPPTMGTFTGHNNSPEQGLLHFVTARALLEDIAPAAAYETTLRFLPIEGLLQIHQHPFIAGVEAKTSEAVWQDLLSDVTAISVRYSDGKNWETSWDMDKQRNWPASIQFELTVKDRAQRERQYQLAASPMMLVCVRAKAPPDKTARAL